MALPYSPFLRAGNIVAISGQIGLGETGLPESFSDQAQNALTNCEKVLGDAGLKKTDVFKVTVFLSDLNNFATLNEIYSRFFESHLPARTTVEVSALPLSAKIEIDMLAWDSR